MPINIIVDSNINARGVIAHQLSQINKDTVLQFHDLEKTRIYLSQQEFKNNGTIFITYTEGAEKVQSFLNYMRATHSESSIVMVSGALSLDEMRALIQLGVDQILLQPFTVQQLKDKMAAAVTFRKQVLTENAQKPSSTHFEARVADIAPKYYRVALAGWLGENCQLPDVKPNGEATMFVDCDLLKGINSVGVRSWVLWFKAMSQNGFFRFEFENLRPAILQQASFIQGFIPEAGVINSFYIYYWSDELDDEKDFKITRGKEFVNEQMKLPKIRQVDVNGKQIQYEIDAGALKFLKFFKGKIDIS